MTKAEEILEKYPKIILGLDDEGHYEKKNVLNAINEALPKKSKNGMLWYMIIMLLLSAGAMMYAKMAFNIDYAIINGILILIGITSSIRYNGV